MVHHYPYQNQVWSFWKLSKLVQLCSIFLDEENEFISGLNQPDLRTWLNIANINGEYVASDGTPLQYTNWQRNEPKNKTGSEYGQDTHLINLIQSSWSNITWSIIGYKL